VFSISERMLDHMEDADVWELVLAIERLKTTTADAIRAGIDGCYVRTLRALAFLAARDVLEIAKELVDPEDMFRDEADLRRETP